MNFRGDPNVTRDASCGMGGRSPTSSTTRSSTDEESRVEHHIEQQRARTTHDAQLVHELRKTIKRMRALARILRYELGEWEFERANRSLRSAGRRLASERDAEVRLRTLESLYERHPKALSGEGIEQLRKQLEHAREQTSQVSHAHEMGKAPGGCAQSSCEPQPTSSPTVNELLADIAFMHNTIASWRRLDLSFEAIAPGLRRIYSEARRRYARVRDGGAGEEDLHDWRKRAKALYYALDMVRDENQDSMRKITKLTEHLGDVLGEHHDLGMLGTYVEEHSDAFGDDKRSHKLLLKTIEQRQRGLHKQALRVGERVFEPKPDDFLCKVR